MAEMARANLEPLLVQRTSGMRAGGEIHPAWSRLMRYCAELGHGEIEKLKIQDGLPMAAEVTTRKVKFSP
jgi:hypothetical protein